MTARRLVLVVILCAVGIATRIVVARGVDKYSFSIGTDLILLCAIIVLWVAALKFIQRKSRKGPPR